jgi:RimJ/RimL family protein N-acetyltransferase
MMEDENIIIRHGAVEDAEILSVFMNRLADEPLDTVSRQRYTAEEERDFLQKAADKECAFFLLALHGPGVVGVLDLWAGEKQYERHAGRLGVSVLQPYRRRGIARRLLQAAITEAKDWPGFCRIELDVVPWNTPAIRLYRSFGFAHEGRKRKAVDLRGKPEDMLLMALVW